MPTSPKLRKSQKPKDERRQRVDRDTNRGLDKSQHAKKWYFGSGRVASWNSFIWSGACVQSSHQESLLSCLRARRLRDWLAEWPAGWLAERACCMAAAAAAACMAAQGPTSGSSLLRAHSDRPGSAKGNLSPLIPTPMTRSNCHPSLFSQRWRDES